MNNLLSFASVMKSLGGVLLAVVILLAMVTIHEFGHYIAGKILGFKINEFSVGFGPAIFKKRSKKTGELFAVRVIPLGGYCAFDGEDDYDEEEDGKPSKTEEPVFEGLEEKPVETENGATVSALNEEALTEKESETAQKEEEYPEPKGARFNDQAPWKRIIVLLAGATMNYLLALFLIVIMFTCIGRPMYKVFEKPAEENAGVETTVEGLDSEAPDGDGSDNDLFGDGNGATQQPEPPKDPERSLLKGDVVLEIEGESLYLITDYMDELNGKKKGDTVKVKVLRDGKEKTLKITLLKDLKFDSMADSAVPVLNALGIDGLEPTRQKQGFFEGLGHSFAYSGRLGSSILRSLGELVTGKLSITSMGGPVTTISVTADAASSGLLSFLNIAAFIGVNLAVFNLLPIPALDGCKVIFCIIEWIRKKPVSRKVETIIHFVGIIALFGFAILVDLLHFII